MRCGERAGAVLQPEGTDIVRRGADENDPRGCASLGEFHVFGEEAIARMDGAGARRARRIEDRGDVEIALRCARAADADGFVGQGDVERFLVGFRIDGNGA